MVASVVLVTTDSEIAEGIGQAVASVPGCRLDFVDKRTADCVQSRAGGASLIFYNLASEESETRIPALLQSNSTEGNPVAVVVLADRHDSTQAFDLLRRGAADYLGRPLDLRRVAMLTDIITAKTRIALVANEQRAAAEIPVIQPGTAAIYCQQHMSKLSEDARAVAPLETTVLLSGETGTGKTRLARLIHDLSPRRLQPFMIVNCGTLSDSLIESELFGHVKGAFTGADRDRAGKCEAAGQGTLMLDDIDLLSPATQAKLLRAVDERIFEPVGSNHGHPLAARIIVATNRCLEQEVAAGRFRSDLYYRINVVSLHVPPLRDRAELIEPLVRQFLGEFGIRDRGRPFDISAEALDALRSFEWPGNIRQLRNVIERAIALCRGSRCELGDLPESVGRPQCERPLPEARHGNGSRWARKKSQSEANLIAETLVKCKNNRSLAARELGISRVTLYKMLHRHGFIGSPLVLGEASI